MLVNADVERRCLELAGLLPAPVAPPADEEDSEKWFQADVVRFAERCGWTVYHTYDSRKSKPGFLDLIMVRERIVFAELKTEAGRLTAAQESWIELLRLAGGEVYEWRPSMWPAIEQTLR